VIGIPCPAKRTAGGGRGFSASSARPFRPNYSNRLLRRRSGFRGGSSSVGSRIGGAGSSVGSIGSSVGGSSTGIGGGISHPVGSGSSGIARRFSGGSSGVGGSSSSVGSLFLLGTTGAQHEGNRNGAPDLCIHRQLPQ
jgi:hypothetical protein